MKKPKKPITAHEFAIRALRRASLRWPARNQAKIAARRSRGMYECCNCHKLFGPKEINLDHRVEVVGNEGFTTFDDYINRLFCDVNNFQVLCKNCHAIKSMYSQAVRKIKKQFDKKPRKK